MFFSSIAEFASFNPNLTVSLNFLLTVRFLCRRRSVPHVPSSQTQIFFILVVGLSGVSFEKLCFIKKMTSPFQQLANSLLNRRKMSKEKRSNRKRERDPSQPAVPTSARTNFVDSTMEYRVGFESAQPYHSLQPCSSLPSVNYCGNGSPMSPEKRKFFNFDNLENGDATTPSIDNHRIGRRSYFDSTESGLIAQLSRTLKNTEMSSSRSSTSTKIVDNLPPVSGKSPFRTPAVNSNRPIVVSKCSNYKEG